MSSGISFLPGVVTYIVAKKPAIKPISAMPITTKKILVPSMEAKKNADFDSVELIFSNAIMRITMVKKNDAPK